MSPLQDSAHSIKYEIRQWVESHLASEGIARFWDARPLADPPPARLYKCEIRFAGSRQADMHGSNPRMEWTGILWIKCQTQRRMGDEVATLMADSARDVILVNRHSGVSGLVWRVPSIRVGDPGGADLYQMDVECPFVASTYRHAA